MTKENIKEQVMGSMPVKTAGSGNVRGSGVQKNLNPGKVTPQSQIRKIDPKQFDNRSAAVTTNTPSGGSLKAGSFGISQAGKQQAAANRAEFKAKADAVKASESKPVVSSTTKQGKPRTKAQMMAAKRIASGKTIADVKKSNTDAMRARAAKRFADFKAKREAKRLERMKKEENTPYDMVLEYLLSTEQVDTIEEANYVMMQLDEENIQEIVGQVAKLVMKTPLVKLVPAAGAVVAGTGLVASKLGKKSVKPVAPPEVKKPSKEIQVGDGIPPQKPGESLFDYYRRRKNSLETQDKKLGSGDY